MNYIQLEFNFMQDFPELYYKPWEVREFQFVASFCPPDYWTDEELDSLSDPD